MDENKKSALVRFDIKTVLFLAEMDLIQFLSARIFTIIYEY